MKYYQIREFETAHPESHDGIVSEEELKRRASLFVNAFVGDAIRPEQIYNELNILLHGDGEKGEEPQCHTCEHKIGYPPKVGWCYMFKTKIPKCRKYIPQKDLPSPAPTRDEWEAWAEKMPNPSFDFHQCTGIDWIAWANRMIGWFKSMPIVPRGK